MQELWQVIFENSKAFVFVQIDVWLKVSVVLTLSWIDSFDKKPSNYNRVINVLTVKITLCHLLYEYDAICSRQNVNNETLVFLELLSSILNLK